MRFSVLIAVVALGLTCVAAQRISGGSCPDVTVKSDFDVSEYTGLWYSIAAIPASFGTGLKCSTATYENKGDYVSVLNKGIDVNTGKVSSIEGKATIPDPKVPAKLEVEFPGVPRKGKYWVLDTDYENYSLVYSCSSFVNIFKSEFIWILSRQPTLDDDKREKIYKVLQDNGVSKDGLKPSVQDCA